jgi:hypothetical protein
MVGVAYTVATLVLAVWAALIIMRDVVRFFVLCVVLYVELVAYSISSFIVIC